MFHTLTALTKGSRVGTGDLLPAYLHASNDFVLGQFYALTIMSQQALDAADLDSGLAVKIAAYQASMKKQARYFDGQLMGSSYGFITQVAEGFNICALANGAITLEQGSISIAAENAQARGSAASTFRAVAGKMGDAQVAAETLAAKCSSLKYSLDSFIANYRTALSAAAEELGKSIAATLTEIDTLKAAINQNIEDIVAGGEEVGGGVTTLALGILTTITSAKPDKPEKPEGDKPEAKGDEPEPASAEFAVVAIKAATVGAAKMSKAGADLNANNEKLAGAYQTLASANAALAIAKVVAVQSDLFAGAIPPAAVSAQGIAVGLTDVQSGFSSFAKSIDNLADDVMEAKGLALESQQASAQWTALAAELKAIKTDVITMGGFGA